jgi:WD40 repeat protein
LTGYGGQVAYSPDRQRLASSAANEIRLMNATGSETATLKGHRDLVTSITFSPDGQRLASASVDKTIKVWDVVTGQETMTLDGHVETISNIAFSPDGKLLASVSQQGTIKLWDARLLAKKDADHTDPQSASLNQ